MRRIVLTYGLICGALMSAMMLLTLTVVDRVGYDRGAIIGYTGMVLSFLMIWFGVRTYRDDVAGGSVSFWQACKVGFLIMAIGAICYVATWEVVYFNFMPDFMEKYSAAMMDKARQSGATEAQLAKQAKDFAEFSVAYKNPLVNIAYSLMEPLPVGLPFVLLTALVMSRKRRAEAVPAT